MLYIIWSIIVILFILSLIGVVIPLIPATLPLWIALLLYHFLIAEVGFSFFFWLFMILITLLILISDFLTNVFFLKKYDGSKWSILGASLGIIVGTIILGPFGLFLGPLLFVFIITLIESDDLDKSFKTAVGTIFALFSSALIKIILQLIMIIWFFRSV